MPIARKHISSKKRPATQLPWVLSIQQGADRLIAHPRHSTLLGTRVSVSQPHPRPNSHFIAVHLSKFSFSSVRHHALTEELHFHQFRGIVASNNSIASSQAMTSDITDTCAPLLQRPLAVLKSQLHLRSVTPKDPVLSSCNPKSPRKELWPVRGAPSPYLSSTY